MKLYYNDDLCPRCGELTDYYHGKVCKKCYSAHKKEYYKFNVEEIKAQKKEYRKAHAEENKNYKMKQKNSEGKTLNNIRCKSNCYLLDILKHNKLPDYEIHHCFGYEDYTKFIYIPKSLHLAIHQYLRDNNIDAKSEHYKYIVDMINTSEQYTYIHI